MSDILRKAWHTGYKAGDLYALAWEYGLHRFVLHPFGRNKKSMWSFHWHDHHRAASVHGMYDPGYEHSFLHQSAQRKEGFGLIALAVTHLWVGIIAPPVFLGLTSRALKYYLDHEHAHLDLDWARENLPWHYDHHMGQNQDMNWGVTSPLFDILFGTRVPYKGTEKEARQMPGILKRYEKVTSPEEVLRREQEYVPTKLETIVETALSVVKGCEEAP